MGSGGDLYPSGSGGGSRVHPTNTNTNTAHTTPLTPTTVVPHPMLCRPNRGFLMRYLTIALLLALYGWFHPLSVDTLVYVGDV